MQGFLVFVAYLGRLSGEAGTLRNRIAFEKKSVTTLISELPEGVHGPGWVELSKRGARAFLAKLFSSLSLRPWREDEGQLSLSIKPWP